MIDDSKIQRTQEALVNSHMRTISALKESLRELEARGLIRPFRISLAVSKEQDEQIKQLQKEGKSIRQIAAETNVSKSAVSLRTKKPSNYNIKSVHGDRQIERPFQQVLAAAHSARSSMATQEIVTAAYAVAEAWRVTADQLKESLNGKKKED